MTERKRAMLDLSDDPSEDGLDLSAFSAKPPPKISEEDQEVDKTAIKRLSEAAGWPSRQAGRATMPTRRPRRPTTPYNAQLNVKCRMEMRALFREISDRIGQRDCDTFEQAVSALVSQLGDDDLKQRLATILPSDQTS
ncbi:MAG: hypothetical protein AAGI03_02285 [Pseudomonadota bacterium]